MTTIWSFPTRIIFGSGSVQSAAAELVATGAKRTLLVTDAGVVNAGLADTVRSALKNGGVSVEMFSGVSGNPTEDDIEAGAEAFSQAGADSVVCLGGGSPMDAGKLIALRSVNQCSFQELDDAVGGDRLITEAVPPIVAIPTTAGTGSEVGRAGVVTVRATGRKTVIFSPRLLPRVAILDPELTRSMPPGTTAATGFDALTHCLEAYVALGDHPMADGIAIRGIELVRAHLVRAVSAGDDLEARGAMMKAAMMGAVAFQKGLGACHSMAHPLSSECGVHHGLANALCLPAVVEFNLSAASEQLGRVAGIFGQTDCAAAIRDFRAAVGLPSSLSELDIESATLDRLADLAFEDGCHKLNPRPCTRDDLFDLYHRCL